MRHFVLIFFFSSFAAADSYILSHHCALHISTTASQERRRVKWVCSALEKKKKTQSEMNKCIGKMENQAAALVEMMRRKPSYRSRLTPPTRSPTKQQPIEVVKQLGTINA